MNGIELSVYHVNINMCTQPDCISGATILKYIFDGMPGYTVV